MLNEYMNWTLARIGVYLYPSKSIHKVNRQATESSKFRSKLGSAKSAGKRLRASHNRFWIYFEAALTAITFHSATNHVKHFIFSFSTVTPSLQGVDINFPRDYSERVGS